MGLFELWSRHAVDITAPVCVCGCVQNSVFGTDPKSFCLAIPASFNQGIALSRDGSCYVVSNNQHSIGVFDITGAVVRRIGGYGSGEGEFAEPWRLTFTASGTLLVAERLNKRVQEVTLDGAHVRFIGVGVFTRNPDGVATNDEYIVVTQTNCGADRIVMFNAGTSEHIMSFGDASARLGRGYCFGVRFSRDGRRIVVAEERLLAVYDIFGDLVTMIGDGELVDAGDVDFAANGDIIVSQYKQSRLSVYSADGVFLRHWEYRNPQALAVHDNRLYVLSGDTSHVTVFK